jgi:hypothetical protein
MASGFTVDRTQRVVDDGVITISTAKAQPNAADPVATKDQPPITARQNQEELARSVADLTREAMKLTNDEDYERALAGLPQIPAGRWLKVVHANQCIPSGAGSKRVA